MHKIIPLWGVPRSISTAFERMMMERGDFKCLHDLFSYSFYFGEGQAAPVGQTGEGQPHGFDDIVAMIIGEAQDRPVFFKDMAYCVIDHADDDFLRLFTSTFLTRDPALTLRSYYKLQQDFTMKEAGFEEQFKLFEMVKRLTGEVPPVVDAEDLIASPHTVVKHYCQRVGIEFLPETLTWESTRKPEWKSFEYWHKEVSDSTGFTKDAESFDFEIDDVPRLKEMYEKSMPYYEALHGARIRP